MRRHALDNVVSDTSHSNLCTWLCVENLACPPTSVWLSICVYAFSSLTFCLYLCSSRLRPSSPVRRSARLLAKSSQLSQDTSKQSQDLNKSLIQPQDLSGKSSRKRNRSPSGGFQEPSTKRQKGKALTLDQGPSSDSNKSVKARAGKKSNSAASSSSASEDKPPTSRSRGTKGRAEKGKKSTVSEEGSLLESSHQSTEAKPHIKQAPSSRKGKATKSSKR